MDRRRRLVSAVVVALVTAPMVWVGEGLRPLWFLPWIAPVPLLLYALRSRALDAAVVAAVAWSVGRGALVPLFRALEMPAPLVALIVVGPATLVAGIVALTRSLVRRGAPFAGALAFPAAWVGLEYLASAGPDGTWGARGYTQVDALPIVQCASVTGVWGVSFLVAFAASGVAVGIHAKDRRLLALTAAVVLAAVSFGAWRLHAEGADSVALRVGQAAVVQTDAAAKQIVSGDLSGARRTILAYSPLVTESARAGAQVVVLPEEIVGVRDADRPVVDAELAGLAARHRVTLVVGLRVVGDPKGRNVALVLAPDGALVAEYTKQHLVPRWETERLSPGRDLAVANAPVRFGVAICKDMDFAAPASRYGEAGVGVLFVPAWDFRLDGWLHARMAIMRGVEQGLPMVRSAQEGLLTVSDAYGRVVAQTLTGAAPVAQIATVPVGRRPTVYGRAGDVFAALDLALVAALLARCLRLSARARAARRASAAAHVP